MFVLNLPVAMLVFLRLFLVALGLSAFGVPGMAVEQPSIDSPSPGQALQGVIAISGSTDVEDFVSFEVSFRFEEDQTDTWYLIQQGRESVENGQLASWDTTTIADGEYRLRIMVYMVDGTTVESIVPNLRVRNYTLIETSTPLPTSNSVDNITPTNSPVPVPRKATPTSLPPNPASVSPDNLIRQILYGFVFTFAFFVLLALYLWYRGLRRKP